jgi:hypothetical protein
MNTMGTTIRMDRLIFGPFVSFVSFVSFVCVTAPAGL